MYIKVLGSGAGGGFPQWNCHCRNCRGFREGSLNAKARTQSSIAVSSNKKDWLLINTSPDIREQLLNWPNIYNDQIKRGIGVKAILLMDAQIDHTGGLLFLRESHEPLEIYCTKSVYEDLERGNPLFKILDSYCGTNWNEVKVSDEKSFEIRGIEGLSIFALPIDSKPPPFSPRRGSPVLGDNIALIILDKKTGRKVFYAPGVGQFNDKILKQMKTCDLLMVDGTMWTEDEMIAQGLGKKMAKDMGHLPLSGEGGMIQLLEKFKEQRKVLIHINNSNPILNEDSIEREIIKKLSIEVAYDGMEYSI